MKKSTPKSKVDRTGWLFHVLPDNYRYRMSGHIFMVQHHTLIFAHLIPSCLQHTSNSPNRDPCLFSDHKESNHNRMSLLVKKISLPTPCLIDTFRFGDYFPTYCNDCIFILTCSCKSKYLLLLTLTWSNSSWLMFTSFFFCSSINKLSIIFIEMWCILSFFVKTVSWSYTNAHFLKNLSGSYTVIMM